MAQIDYKNVLADFMADIKAKNYSDEEIFKAYPEFNNDKAMLDAAYQYANTVREKKYDEATLQSKFPEFFPKQSQASEQTTTKPRTNPDESLAFNPPVKGNEAPTTDEEYQDSMRRQDAAQGIQSQAGEAQPTQVNQPTAWQTFWKGLGAGAINTANGLISFLSRANTGQIAYDPVILQQMAKQGMSPEEIAQAADATKERLEKAETERYDAWKEKADKLSDESKPDGGEKSFTD